MLGRQLSADEEALLDYYNYEREWHEYLGNSLFDYSELDLVLVSNSDFRDNRLLTETQGNDLIARKLISAIRHYSQKPEMIIVDFAFGGEHYRIDKLDSFIFQRKDFIDPYCDNLINSISFRDLDYFNNTVSDYVKRIARSESRYAFLTCGIHIDESFEDQKPRYKAANDSINTEFKIAA